MLELISIVMPAYNAAQYIEQSIESVLKQSYTNWELIIVDDCSVDDTYKIVDKLCLNEERIKLFRMNENSGVAMARNFAISMSRGKYIAFLDSDDLWLPDKLEKQLNLMQEKKAVISYTAYRQFSMEKVGNLVSVPEQVTYKQLLKGNVIGCLTVMLDKERLGNLQMKKARHEDYILWLDILKQGNIAYGLQEDLARYRKSETSLTSNKKRSALWTWQVYRQHQELSFFASIYYFIFYVCKGLLKHL